MNDVILLALLAAIPASFGYFLYYCMGEPMSDEPKTREIFSSYSLWLAKKRLDTIKASVDKSDISIYRNLYQLFIPRLSSDSPTERNDARTDFNKTLLFEAQKYWNTEKAFGMCPYCSNFWLALIAAIIFFFFIPLPSFSPFTYFIIVPVFSHSILRKLLKK